MRILCRVTWEKDEQTKEGESIMDSGDYFLLHWGLQYEIIQLEEGHVAAVNYTIAICQDCETGEVRCVLPEQIRILGNDIK
jgi:predicted metal-binding protein